MKFILSLLLLFVAAPIYAADTGLFWNPEKDGEGLLIMKDDRIIITYFFTYSENACDDEIYTPDVGPVVQEFYDCSLQGQSWYFTSDKWNYEDQEATGFLFKARGTNYPKGIPDKTNPFAVILGEAFPVGFYVLRKSGEGYQMLIVPYGDVDKENPIYNQVYNFTEPLFVPLGVKP